MRSISFRAVAVVALSFVLFACPAPPNPCDIDPSGDDCEPDGSVPDDKCNSAEEAMGDPRCAVVVGDACPAARGGVAEVTTGYITTLLDGGLDRDFYVATLPSGLTPRCLLHVSAGYSVPQTAVNLSVNVLESDGVKSIMSGIDRHDAAAPKFVDLIVPYSTSNAKILIALADEGKTVQPHVDNRNPYSLKVEVTENPDPNEPNDETATAIPLMAGTPDGVTGTSFGYLATKDDVDTYSFDVSESGRRIIYLSITSPMAYSPPPPFKLSYGLFDPDGTQVSEGIMANEFLQVDLKTARLAAKTGTYKVVIKGYKADGQTAPILGDLRLRYDVEVRVMPDLDTREPNDAVTTAQTVNIANGTTTITGRLSYVADEEWFKLVVGASGTARTLRYEITVAEGGGRFPPLTAVASRQARLATEVTTGPTRQDRTTNCSNDPAYCPRSFEGLNTSNGQLVSTLCAVADPPQCLWGERNEEAQINGLKPLKNFVGAVPVPTSGKTFLMMFRDQGARDLKYADDREWSMRITLANDDDAQGRVGGPQVVNLTGTLADSPGVISYGYGRLLDFDANAGRGIRGPRDYDAHETDKDLYQFNYPGGSTGDQAWGLEWVINNNTDGGRAPGDLAFEVTLCGNATPATDGGLCGAEQRFILAASLTGVTPWYLPVTNGNQRMLFTKTVSAATTTITATPAACYCHADSKVTAGRFFVNVAGIDRVSNEPIEYRFRQSIAPYPNGNAVCPVGNDGGCRFPR